MNEDKSLVINETVRSLAANIDQELFGYDELPETSGSPSIIKLCQHSTQKKPAGVENGDFFDATMDVNHGKAIEFYVVHMYTPRIKYNKDKTVECRSQDGKVGIKYGSCAACKHSQWDPEAKDRCNKQVGAVIMLKGGGLPSLLMFDKSRHKVGWELIRKMNSLKIQNQAKPQDQRVPLMFYRFKATSKPTVLNENDIQTIVIQNAGVLENPQEADLLVSMKNTVAKFVDKASEVVAAPEEQEGSTKSNTTDGITNY
jgi:hypothetical protein